MLRHPLLQYDELITAIARNKAAGRRTDVLEYCGNNLKSMVALHMSILIVNLLKAVGVHHEQIHIFGLIHI